MKLFCKGVYHNAPADLHFVGPLVIEIDNWKGEYLLRDAPENFTRELPAPPEPPRANVLADADSVREKIAPPITDKALDEPPADKQVKAPARKK